MTTTVTTTNSVSTMSSNISSISTTSVSDTTTTSQSIQNTIDVSINNQSGEDTQELVETIIAANLQQAQEEVETQQQETGEYGSEDTIIAYMSFVPNFNTYATAYIPKQEQWYESTDIYTSNIMTDNIEAFYGLAGQSLETLTQIKNLQPNL